MSRITVHLFNIDGEEVGQFEAIASAIDVPITRKDYDAEQAIAKMAKAQPNQDISLLVDRNPFESDAHPRGRRVKAGDHAIGADAR